MNTLQPTVPQWSARNDDAVRESPAPTGAGVQRYLWEARYGSILIEVIGDCIFVNGQLVEPAR